jgi:hypothetical protein
VNTPRLWSGESEWRLEPLRPCGHQSFNYLVASSGFVGSAQVGVVGSLLRSSGNPSGSVLAGVLTPTTPRAESAYLFYAGDVFLALCTCPWNLVLWHSLS